MAGGTYVFQWVVCCYEKTNTIYQVFLYLSTTFILPSRSFPPRISRSLSQITRKFSLLRPPHDERLGSAVAVTSASGQRCSTIILVEVEDKLQYQRVGEPICNKGEIWGKVAIGGEAWTGRRWTVCLLEDENPYRRANTWTHRKLHPSLWPPRLPACCQPKCCSEHVTTNIQQSAQGNLLSNSLVIFTFRFASDCKIPTFASNYFLLLMLPW